MTSAPERRPDNDTYYMGVAMAVRERATCTGNRIGAVAVLQNRIIAPGSNGVPEGMKNCLEGGCLRCRNPKGRFPSGTGYDPWICGHAEQNLLWSAARFGIAGEGATIYSTMQPCFAWGKELLQAKVRRIVSLHPGTPSDADPEMDSSQKAEHEKLRAKCEMKRLPIKDLRAKGAVTALRKKS